MKYDKPHKQEIETRDNKTRTLTTREEAFPCSYTLSADPTSGKFDIRETKGELALGSEVGVDVDGVGAEGMDGLLLLLLLGLLLFSMVEEEDMDKGGRMTTGCAVVFGLPPKKKKKSVNSDLKSETMPGSMGENASRERL